MKVLTVVGARPQFIKAAAISRAIRQEYSSRINEVLLHTGQHYDPEMNQVFFEELGLPQEDYNLNVGSGTHAVQTAAIMVGIEEILLKEKPDCLLLYGDTNSTLAGAVAASKLHIPIVHVEGGVRSYNKGMPEEVNRVMCDHLSTLIFVPTKSGMESLRHEGFKELNQPPFTPDNPKVYHCGDIMYDNSLLLAEVAKRKSTILDLHNLRNKKFALVTMHRPENVDDRETLGNLFRTFNDISIEEKIEVIVPLHPRTKKVFDESVSNEIKDKVRSNPLLKIIPPVSFLDITALEMEAEIVLTDSGGVQKEAYYFKKPCVIMMKKTAWVELEQSGTAVVTSNQPEKIRTAFKSLMAKKNKMTFPEIFGDGKASAFICERMIENFSTTK
ncbi:MAG: UDP-N-acetylglucosamine 2-epimerase (non-hydrolyzing) [Bacteroidetes bacterium]|nr:UDP-N-acetylglucosamine 2-epimerase (non-hydrolyzing) [Bacteroidota bacterium]